MEHPKEVSVVVVPFPAQGHLNQLLHFSLLLSSHGLPVHYICSAPHVRQANHRVQGWDSNALQTITFHDLPLPPFSNPPPDPNADTKFPAHLQPLFEATLHLRPPLASLLRSISASSRRLVVIHEPLTSFAGHEAASLPNAETYLFHCIPAFNTLSYTWKNLGKAAEPGTADLSVIHASFDGIFSEQFMDFIIRHHLDTVVEAGNLINTCRPIEGKFIDLLAQEPSFRDKQLFAVGPLNPVMLREGSTPRHECIEWLDKQPPNSVVFVSFGTTSSLPAEQIEELATGLLRSGQRFIWVLREADRGDIFADGEEGRPSPKLRLSEYEGKVEGVGIIVKDWAPQLEILAHPSTGAFMSHCGWNSCMESLSMGVPIVAWPMHSDQPRNAMMVTENLKVAVTVREWDRRGEIVSAAGVEDSIKRVMVYDEGKEIKRRAKDMGEAIQEAIAEGGTSRADLVSFIAHVSR